MASVIDYLATQFFGRPLPDSLSSALRDSTLNRMVGRPHATEWMEGCLAIADRDSLAVQLAMPLQERGIEPTQSLVNALQSATGTTVVGGLWVLVGMSISPTLRTCSDSTSAVLEVVRRWSPSWMVFRDIDSLAISNSSCARLGAGAGSKVRVGIPLGAFNTSRRTWEQPLRIDPYRQELSRTHLAFGYGRGSCPGRDLALAVMSTVHQVGGSRLFRLPRFLGARRLTPLYVPRLATT